MKGLHFVHACAGDATFPFGDYIVFHNAIFLVLKD